MLETLSYIFDWRQIINSLVGSVIAATIVVPITIYLFQRVAHWANRKKLFLGISVTASGFLLLIILVGPSALESFKNYKVSSSVLALARTFGGDEPQPRLAFYCEGQCNLDLNSAAEICLDSKVQTKAERIAHYGSRNRAGLRIFVDCMKVHGYSVAHCEADTSSCISVPDTGFRNFGSSVHFSYECQAEKDRGVICEVSANY